MKTELVYTSLKPGSGRSLATPERKKEGSRSNKHLVKNLGSAGLADTMLYGLLVRGTDKDYKDSEGGEKRFRCGEVSQAEVVTQPLD